MPANQSQRPKFYEEQYLGAADLTAAVDYARVQQARHALGAHTWGIAIGLQLKETPLPSGAVSVHLLPGYAWDGYGRPIIVLAPYKIPEEIFSAIKFDAAIDAGGKGRLIPVWLRYDETATQRPRPGFELCDSADQFSRVQETFRLVISEQGLGVTDRSSGIRIAAKTLSDAKMALQAFDPTAPLVYDESIPQQVFPEPQEKARWLIPIGYVRWLPVQNGPGHFVARDDSGAGGAEKDSDKIRRVRRYIGVVTEEIEAADGVIRLRDRGKDPASGFFQAPLTVTDPKNPPTNDLVWVEGHLRVLGDARLAGGKLDFRDEQGNNFNTPLAVQRANDGSALRLVIGRDTQLTNRLAVGPLKASDNSFDEKFVVLSNGNVGVGTTAPRAALDVTTNRLTAQDQAVVGLFRGGAKEPADGRERARFIIEGGTDKTSPSLELRSNDPTGSTRGTHLYYAPPQWANVPEVPEHFGIWTHGRGTALSIHSATNNVGIGTISPAGKLTIEAAEHINVLIDRTGQDHMTLTVGTGGTGIHFGDGNRFFISADPYSERNTLGFGNEVLTILPNGHVGIGTNTPAYRLDVASRVRVRQGNDGSAGIWFAQNGPNTDRAFVGMALDNLVGFYGHTGQQFGLVMDTTSGSVGIGTLSPTLKLDIQGDFGRDTGGPAILHLLGSRIRDMGDGILSLSSGGGIVTFDGNDNVGIGTATPQNLLDVNGDASKSTGAFWTAPSDLRLKKNVVPVTDALHNLLRLRGVQFHWKEPEKMGNLTGVQMGLVAQETEAVFPQWISTGRDGYKQITIRGFEALTVEALRELHTEIETLKIRLDKLTENQPSIDARPRTRGSRKETTHETKD